MKYEYHCQTCEKPFDVDFPFGKAEPVVTCSCGGLAKRVFSAINFAVRGGSVSTGRTFGQEMLRRNRAAGERMRANQPPIRRIATDFGGGDVRGC
jgi:putative FmdB family regulatory protein